MLLVTTTECGVVSEIPHKNAEIGTHVHHNLFCLLDIPVRRTKRKSQRWQASLAASYRHQVVTRCGGTSSRSRRAGLWTRQWNRHQGLKPTLILYTYIEQCFILKKWQEQGTGRDSRAGSSSQASHSSEDNRSSWSAAGCTKKVRFTFVYYINGKLFWSSK